MSTRMDTDKRSQQKSYKKNWPKWVGIYLIVGATIYLIVYFLAFHHGGAGGGY